MIYFDNAATTLRKPDCVIEAVAQALCSLGNSGRGIHDGALSASRTIYDARCALTELFGAESPERIAFTANSTQALNTAIKGVLSPGDHVITTALEHNSVLRPLYELEDRGVALTILPADALGNIRYEDFEQEIRPNTRAIVTTHGSNLTGNLLNIGKIGAIARKHGLTYIVDASQTAGVFDIDVQKMGIDILCFTGHKGLLGPQGTGGLYVRKGVAVRSLLSGGSGVQTHGIGGRNLKRSRHRRSGGGGTPYSEHWPGIHPGEGAGADDRLLRGGFPDPRHHRLRRFLQHGALRHRIAECPGL